MPKLASWGDVYRRYLGRGYDHGAAAYYADQNEKRKYSKRWKHCPSTHCERSHECRSPNECCASLMNLEKDCTNAR